MEQLSGPGMVLFVGRYRVPPDRRTDWLAASREMAAFVHEHLPEVQLFDAFLAPDGQKGTSIHLHRDAAAFRRYLEAAAGRIGAGAHLVEVVRIDIYGFPDDDVVARLRGMGRWPVDVHRHAAGLDWRPAKATG